MTRRLSTTPRKVVWSTKGIGKQAKPEGVSDQDFATRTKSEKDALKTSRDFLESVGFNAIADEKDCEEAHVVHRALHGSLSKFAIPGAGLAVRHVYARPRAIK